MIGSLIRASLKDGSLIPLTALASIGLGKVPVAITRENGKRYIGVRANVATAISAP